MADLGVPSGAYSADAVTGLGTAAAPIIPRGEFGAWTWAGGKEEEEKVHQLLFDPDTSGVKPALRRRALDLAGWPEVNRIVHWVELDCEAQHLYKLAWKQLRPRGRTLH